MGYFDLQVNGYAGVDFNADELSEQALARACELLVADGVDGILATVITDSLDAMTRRLARIVELRASHPAMARVIHGFHIEGPFLNEQPGYIGAHPAAAACPATTDQARRLLEAGCGLVRMVTLAPECDEKSEVTRMLVGQGICVSAGHSNATLDQLKQAIDAGLSMFTHLGNGCPRQMDRHDNIIQRILYLSDRIWVSFIADGVHVPFWVLRNYLTCAGLERSLVVTDAISAAGLGAGTFQLAGQPVVVDEDLATWAPDKSHLMGSASTMPRTAENLRKHLGLSAPDVELLTSRNPRQVIGLTCEK